MGKVIRLLLVLCVMAVTGCGGGNDGAGGLNGSITVVGAQTASDDYSSTVTFTITYTNPFRTDLIGVPLNYVIYVDGQVKDNVATNFNNSGILKVSYNLSKDVSKQFVKCVAKTGNLIGSDTVAIGAFNALSVSPSSQTFAAADPIGTTKSYTVSGGSGSFTATSNVPGTISVARNGSNVDATKLAAGPATVTITITDTITTEEVQVTAIVE